MKKFLLIAAACAALVSPVHAGIFHREYTCIVIDKDPPLNVRATPGGRIIGGFDRGDKVIVVSADRHPNASWVYVESPTEGAVAGWVYRSLLGSCIWENIEGEP